jgi:SNF2 family DNA or RNA helicase
MEFYHDKARKLLIYPLTPGAPLQALPEAKQVNGEFFAVPDTLRNSQILRFYNYPVAPVMVDYDWPCAPAITPYESQKAAANFMVLHPHCFNLSDMGVGKTLAALWAADWLMQHNPGLRALIVCPLSIMERVWADAIWKNFLSRRTFEVLYGSHQKRQTTLEKSKADFLIINFDGLGLGAHTRRKFDTRRKFELDGLSRLLAQTNDIRLAIVDEASGYRDARTKRHRIARAVIGSRSYLWLLTGTPTPNAPTDAYGLAKLVNNAFGKSFTTFQIESMVKVSQFKWAPRRDGYEQARQILTPAIRFDIKDVWDGPELTVQQRQIELTAEQKKLMGELKRDLMVRVKSGDPITIDTEAAARTKFLQISSGAIYDQNHKAHPVDAAPRIEELLAVLDQAPGKCLVFSSFTSIVEMLYYKLDKWTRGVVNGNVAPKERSQLFSDFQREDGIRILLADPGTMAHGLNLWAARTVIWYGPTDKTELYAQANKRAHRPGQRFPVTVVQLVSNSLEREIFHRLENHLSLQGALLDAVTKGDF